MVATGIGGAEDCQTAIACFRGNWPRTCPAGSAACAWAGFVCAGFTCVGDAGFPAIGLAAGENGSSPPGGTAAAVSPEAD